jgi:hypothetical protein
MIRISTLVILDKKVKDLLLLKRLEKKLADKKRKKASLELGGAK